MSCKVLDNHATDGAALKEQEDPTHYYLNSWLSIESQKSQRKKQTNQNENYNLTDKRQVHRH